MNSSSSYPSAYDAEYKPEIMAIVLSLFEILPLQIVKSIISWVE